MWRTAFGVLLILHGLLTILIWSLPPSAEAPMDTGHSWLVGDSRAVFLGLTRFDGQGWCEVGSRYLFEGGGLG
jgi:hypothetical protein